LREPAGVLGAELGLSSPILTAPRSLTTCHDELTDVVNINRRRPSPALREPAPRDRLPDSWPHR
jgi:hypothetical protein